MSYCFNSFTINYKLTIMCAFRGQGCYTDSASSRALASYTTQSSTNTPANCISTCTSRGYSYAGVEYGTECFCGNSINANANANSGGPAPISDCTMTCSGGSGLCGNGNRLFIYRNMGGAITSTTKRTSGSPFPKMPFLSSEVLIVGRFDP